MQKQFVFIACMIAASFFLMLSPAHGHGDHKDQPASEPAQSPVSTDNIYSAEGKTASPDADLPLSRMDMAPDEHMEHKEMKTGHDEHAAGHKMPQVKMATHERVSTSQKGYGLAAGITILAGLVFCALSIIRPNE